MAGPKVVAASSLAILVALYVVGAVSVPPGSLRHEIQTLPLWVPDDLRRCFQIMKCQDRGLLDQWMTNWSDIAGFEVIPVVTSAEAAAAVAPRL